LPIGIRTEACQLFWRITGSFINPDAVDGAVSANALISGLLEANISSQATDPGHKSDRRRL